MSTCSRAIGQSGNYSLFKQGSTSYKQNAGLDKNKDGVITKNEAVQAVIDKMNTYGTK